jgi:hypothetical protein
VPSADKTQLILLQKLFHNIAAENAARAARVRLKTLNVVGIAPHQIAVRAGHRQLLDAVDLGNLAERFD